MRICRSRVRTAIFDIWLVHESAHAVPSSLAELWELANLTMDRSTRAAQSTYTIRVAAPVRRVSPVSSLIQALRIQESGCSGLRSLCVALSVRMMSGCQHDWPFAAFVADSARSN